MTRFVERSATVEAQRACNSRYGNALVLALRSAVVAPLLMFLIAGCGGGSSNSSSTATTTGTGTGTGTGAAYTGPYVLVTANTLVFGARTNGGIFKFRADGSGSISPVSTITTASNGGFHGLAADGSGTLYSQVFDTRDTPILVTYSSTATGETAPGRNNTLGSILIANQLAFGPTGSLLLLDSTVGAQRYDVTSSKAKVVQSLPGVNTGAKLTTINQPIAIAQDTSDNLYVADTQGIKVFVSTATGDTAPLRNVTGWKTTLVSNVNINPNSATIPEGIAVNSLGEIYISTQTFPLKTATSSSTCDTRANVLVFAAGADGNVAPVRMIAGDQTTLCRPSTLLFDKSGLLYVQDVVVDGSRGLVPRMVRFGASASGNIAPLNVFTSTAWPSGGTNFTVIN